MFLCLCVFVFCSLTYNQLGDDGTQMVVDQLHKNDQLQVLWCVISVAHFVINVVDVRNG